MSIDAYKRTIRESETPRQIEARVIARITGALEAHREAFARAESREDRLAALAAGLGAALADNRKLWLTLRDDLADSGNSLAPALRAQLLSIALWIDRQCLKVLGGEGGLDGLIEVNRNILSGLNARPAAATVGSHGTESYAQAV